MNCKNKTLDQETTSKFMFSRFDVYESLHDNKYSRKIRNLQYDAKVYDNVHKEANYHLNFFFKAIYFIFHKIYKLRNEFNVRN